MTRAELIASVQGLAALVPIDETELIGKLEELVNNLAVVEDDLAPISQAEAEAGTATAVQGFSAERVKQAIEALAWNARFSSPVTAANVGSVGGINNGDTVSTIEEFARKLLVRLVLPTISFNGPNLSLEVGTSHVFTYSASYNQNDGGGLVSLAISRSGTQVASGGTSPLTFAEDRLRSAPGTESYVASGSWGANSANGAPSGSANSATRNVTAVYPLFHGTGPSALDGAGVKSLVEGGSGTKTVSNPGGNVTVNYSASSQYLWYAEPATMPVKTEWEVSALNRGGIGGGSNLFAGPVLVDINSPTGLWAAVQYRVYFTNFATTLNANLTFQR